MINSYLRIFRFIFVVFYLYLLRYAFYRWDGFRYHSTFLEFLPNIALLTVLWTIIAVLVALPFYLHGRIFDWIYRRNSREFRVGHDLLFTGLFFLLFGIVVVIIRPYMFPDVVMSLEVKVLTFVGIFLLSAFLTWLFRDMADKLIKPVHEHITPLVWLFGIWLALSIPLVIYHTWARQEDNVVEGRQKIIEEYRNRPNIILITFDAMRIQDMSLYGYDKETTPFIKKWAGKASLFINLKAVSDQTTTITKSLMSSKRPWRHQLYHHVDVFKEGKNDDESLPSVLRDNGYYTMALVQNPYGSVKKLGISEGFIIAPSPSEFWSPVSLYDIVDKKLYQLFGEKFGGYKWIIENDFILYKVINAFSQDFSITSTPAENVFNRFLSIIDNNPPEPFFAWIHLFPPHHPYLPPPPYMGMFDPSPELRTFKSQDVIWSMFFKRKIIHQKTINTMKARYDEFIRYCDKAFEDFVTQLEARGKLKNTVIILSSDHGESFEHNILGHATGHLYEQITNIPLIIKEPGQTEGKVIHDIVRQIDIAPTILDLVNIPIPSWMIGRSLLPLLRGEKLPPVPAFSMQFRQNRVDHVISKGTIAIWEGDYKLIHHLEKNESLLFNLKEDPNELNNLFDKEREIGEHLLELIKNNLKSINERIIQEREKH